MAASKRPQKGGTLSFLGRDSVPEATSPNAMRAAVDFYLISAHGATDLKRFMIVPDNTFIVFLAHSGFVRYVDRDIEKFTQLLNPVGYTPKTGRGAEEAWAEAYYRNFFTGTSKSLQFYPGAAIYGPGDILPDTALSFRSGTQDIWFKGLYSLPVETDRVGDFTLKRNLVYEIADWVKDGTLSRDYILNIAKLKPYKTADFFGMALSLTDEGRKARFGPSPQLKDWFDDVDAITRDFDNTLFYLAEGNLAKEAPIEGLHISEVLENTKSSKPYRFFFVSGCRAPLVPGSTDDEPDPNLYRGSKPVNIPFELPAGPYRRVARRFSVSAKCELGKKPALNLSAARIAFANLITDEGFGRTLQTGGHEPVKVFVRFFRENLLGPDFRFIPAPTAHQFATLLNLAYEEIPEVSATAIPKYVEFVKEVRDAFAELTLQLRRESGVNVRGYAVGDMLKLQLGFPVPVGVGPAGPTGAEVKSHAKIIEREYDVFKRETDTILKAYEDAYTSFREKVAKTAQELEDRLHKSIVRARNEENSAREEPEIQKKVETAYIELIEYGQNLRAAFEAAQTELLQRHRHLGEKVFSYKYKENFEMIERLDRFKGLLKPFQDMVNRLVDRAEERMRGRATKGGRRKNHTRRLR